MSIEHLLLSRHPTLSLSTPDILVVCLQSGDEPPSLTRHVPQQVAEHGAVFAHVQRLFSGRGTARTEHAQGTLSQSHLSPSILVYEENRSRYPLMFCILHQMFWRFAVIHALQQVAEHGAVFAHVERCCVWFPLLLDLHERCAPSQ